MRALVVLVVSAVALASAPAAVADARVAPPHSARASAVPTVDLLPGRGSGRVAITRNGRFAIVHQGDSYDPKALHKVDLRTSPPRVVGSTSLPATVNSEISLVRNKFAWTTHRDELWVTDVRKATPRPVGRFGFKLKGTQATLFDVAVAPDGKFAYAAASDWIHSPGTHLLVLKVRKNGRPKLLRTVKVDAAALAVSRNGKRLIAAAGNRARVFDVRKPRKPRRLGKPIRIKGGDVRDVVFGKSAGVAYTLGANKKYVVSRLSTNQRRVTHRRTLAKGSFLGAGGGIAVRANGKQVVVTNSERAEDEASVWTLNAKLKPRRTITGPCLPRSAAASLRGPTKGRMYVADSGICTGQASVWRVQP